MIRMNTLWALAALFVAAGCESATAPGGNGSAPVDVAIRGDDGNGMSPYRASHGSTTAGSSTSSTNRIDVAARVYLQTQAGEWIAVGQRAARQSVDACGDEGYSLLTSAAVESTTYTRVRVVFDEVETSLDGQISFNGRLLSGVVRVDAGADGQTTVERDIRIQTRGDATTEIRINLNSDAWISSASSSSRTVSEAAFESAVRISAS